MIYIQPGLYVRIQELENGPTPKPLNSGFTSDKAYLVLGAFSISETSEAYFILSNDRDETWFISNRHLRTHQVLSNSTAFRITLTANQAEFNTSKNLEMFNS